MGSLLSALRDKVKTTTKPPEAPKNAPPAATHQAQTPQANLQGATVQLPATLTVGNSGDVKRALASLSASILDAARVLRSSDSAHAWAYRLQRVGMWLPVEKLPPVEGGGTLLPPPPEEQRIRLEKLHAAGNPRELLSVAEEMTGQYLFWLDPHRHVASAMAQLGASFGEARDAVTREVMAFGARLPGVFRL